MTSLLHFFAAGGWVMYPLLLISFVAMGVIVERLLTYRTIANDSPGLLNEVLSSCESGDLDRALNACQKRPGPVAACLGSILAHRNQPVEDIERNVQEVGEEYFIEMEKRLTILDTTTTISPLLGLLGTLFGMIGTFQAITASKNQGNRDSILSGVGEALYATATGLTIAVICFVAYNYFSSRQRAVASEAEQSATKLINELRSRNLIDYRTSAA